MCRAAAGDLHARSSAPERMIFVSTHSIWTGIARGLHLRCPSCGEGKLFRSYLKILSPCPHCGADNTIYPSDDLPPYLTILISGHIIVPLFFLVDRTLEPDMWMQFLIWPPLTLAFTLALLPYVKGGSVGLCWATDTVRQPIASRPGRPNGR